MRSETEMMELIVATARGDERIRAVIMNGSRANPNAPRDPFQDFDIVYLVREVAPFKKNFEWIRRFGELMILQEPDDMQDPPPENIDSFAYLMQFMDGNRIDLGILPLSKLPEIVSDSQSVLLLDKDSLIGALPPASDKDYLPRPPSAKAYFDCCNEFWWVSPYAAKGLWRGEIVYAKQMLDAYVREQLNKMLVWYIGIKTDFSVSPGKYGKYFQRYLEPDLWTMLEKTYSDADNEHTWDALIATTELFRVVALPVAKHFGFAYLHDDDRRVSAYLRRVRSLPRDAKQIY
jgi:aminoglycoside 6-adenylyltransferase